MQLELRLITPILEESYKAQGFLVKKWWIQSVWEHLDYYNLKLVFPHKYYPSSFFINDQGIIETALKLKLFDKEQLRLLNSI